MPPPKRRNHAAVIDRVAAEPHRFSFFQAVRVLERWVAKAPGGELDGLRHIVFRNSLSLAFPASEVESLTILRRDSEAGALSRVPIQSPLEGRVERIELTPSFMGLLGATGTLPHFYTEVLSHRELYARDGSGRAFMDIFSSRALSLFYQAWRKHRLAVHFEADAVNRFLPHVLALAGLGQLGLRQRLQVATGGVADESVAYFAGTLQRRRISASQLQGLLSHYLGVSVAVEPFVGRWYALPVSARAGLGVSAGRLQLGRNALLGDRVWQRDLCVRLVIGPLTHAQHRRFLPGAPGHTALREWLSLVSGHALEYEVNLLLKRDEVRGVTLHGDRDNALGRLGWDTFVQARGASGDRADVRYFVHAGAPCLPASNPKRQEGSK